MSLLDQVTAAAGKSGALKVFLRLPRGSHTERAVMRSGFAVYAFEQSYGRPVDATETHALPEGLRRRTKADLYALFQLYNALVPQPVRSAEAATLAEWSAAQESLGKTTQYVLEREGRIRGWLRVARDGDIARFDLLGEPDTVDELIEAAMAKVAQRRAVYAIAPEHDAGLRSRLESLGFEPGDEYSVLSRRTVRTVKAPKVVPRLLRTPG